jgi:hypothetical protein
MPETDLLLLGTVHTQDPARPRAGAVLVRGGHIARVGSRVECEAAASADARVLDLGAGCITPGLVDAHGHAGLYGRTLVEVDLSDATSEAECVARVRERAKTTPRGQWLRGGGWDQTRWSPAAFPTLDALSAAVPDHPVALARVDVHALWVNARALAECGLDRATQDPPGGLILRRDGGAPAGTLIDTAADLVTARIPPPSAADLEVLVLRGLHALRDQGLTGLHDAAAGPLLLEVFERLASRGALPIRVHAMIDGGCSDEELDRRLRLFGAQREAEKLVLATIAKPTIANTSIGKAAARPLPSSPRLSGGSVKLFADGALGSRGAALFDPYEDDTGNTGLWVTPPGELRRRILRLLSLGVQPGVHCIGDKACHAVLSAFEEGARTLGGARLRPRAEHLQLLRPQDARLLAVSGAVASMQPIHAASDGRWAEARLGHGTERQRGAYAWRQALQAGAVLALGSDVPVELPDPRLGLAAAIARTPAGAAGPWMPEQRLTLDEALRGFTWGAAFAEHAEHLRGQVREGLEADLTLWKDDLFQLAPSALASARVAGTVVGGDLRD